MKTLVVLAGGVPHAHDFGAIGAALTDVARTAGFEVTRVDHPDDAVAELREGAAALVVDALFWRMIGDAYDAWRDDWAYSPPPATRDALAEYVRSGGGLVAVHTAPICFDDWPEWAAIVGGAWSWGTSSHPPYGAVTARLVAAHPVTAGVASSFDLVDEVYGDLSIHPDAEVLAVAKRSADDADQPVVWAHRYGRGRVVFDGFGHDAGSIEHPVNAQILVQAMHWVTEGS